MKKDNKLRSGALYIRVSTDDQTEYSPDAQKRLLLDYAKKNNIMISNEYIFIEEGISGTKADKRPLFQKMIGLAKSKDKPFDVILLWKFSRFARNQEESIVYKNLLKKNNVDVVSVSEPIPEGPFGELIERIIEWMDEYYSIRLGEDVRRGMTEKALRGGIQTKASFGYSIKDNILYEDDDAPVVRKMFEMYLNDGKSFFNIARKLNEMQITTKNGNKFETRTVKYILQNPVYKGYVRWNPNKKTDLREEKNLQEGEFIIEKGKHDPIVPEEIWDAVNDRISKTYRPKNYRSSATVSHWLCGILQCDTCGSTLATTGNITKGFQCSHYSKGKCTESHFVKHYLIEESVLTALKDISLTGNFEYEILQADNKDERSLIEEALKKLSAKEGRIKNAYINGIDSIEEYKENKNKLAKEKISLEKQLETSKELRRSKKTDDEMTKRIDSLIDIVKSNESTEKKNTAIKRVIKKIVYDKKNEHIDIHFYFS